MLAEKLIEIKKVDVLCHIKFGDKLQERSRVNMARAKADSKPKVSIYLVSYDNGKRVETPWEKLSSEEKQAWHQRTLDRMMDTLGYRRASAEETAKALAAGDYVTL